MNLKNLFVAVLLCTPGLVLASNTAVFQGVISVPTCNVTVNGGSAPSVTVLLPTVSLGDFAQANARAGETSFTIAVSECNYAGDYLRPSFVGNNTDGTGRLKNTVAAGFATGVVLEVGYASGVAVDLRNWIAAANTTQGIKLSGSGGNRYGSKEYYVRYYRPASSPVNIGKVFGSMQYSIVYP